MRSSSFYAGLLCAVLASASVVQAQLSEMGQRPQTNVVSPGSGGYGQGGYGGWGGWGGGGGYHHASTAAEGSMRGMADMTRSAGMANVMNSEAAINYETARTQNIENRVYGTEAYFNMRNMNKEARAAEAGPRPTESDLVRYAKERTPKQLSVSDVDPFTGSISWPPVLKDDAFSAEREALNSMFQAKATSGTLTISQRNTVQGAAQSMQSTLKSNINAFSPQDYVNAKQFIESLRYELYSG